MNQTLYFSPRASRKALNRFFSYFEAHKDELHTFQMYDKSGLLVSCAPDPYSVTDKREVYSLSKSFTSTAIGILVNEGKLSEDDRIVDLFPDKCPDEISENLAAMRLRHVLSMNTGHDECIMPYMIHADDPVKAFLSHRVVHAPGTHFAYNTGATCMLSCIVEHVSGMKLLDYLTVKLFLPLGITNVQWNQIHAGHNEGGCGAHLSCEDVAKFGLFYLNRGVVGNKKVLSDAWLDVATSPVSSTSNNGTGDWCAGYGYQIWMCERGGYRGDGAFGQLCVVLPQYDIVFALQTEHTDLQWEMNCLYELAEHIYDADETTVSVVAPSYPPAKSSQKCAGFEYTYYRLLENPMGLVGLYTYYDAERDTYNVTFSDGCEQFSIAAGDGKWVESTWYAAYMKPKIFELMCTNKKEVLRVAASYEASDDAVKLHLRWLNNPHKEFITLTRDGDDIAVHFHAPDRLPQSAVDIKGTAYK